MSAVLLGWHAKVWLLHIKCKRNHKSTLTLNIARETCSYLPDFMLIPYTNWDGSVLFAISPEEMGLRVCRNADIMSGCICLISASEVFFLGQGVSKKGKANRPYYMLLDSFRRFALPLMHEARSYPGVAYMKGRVYVFAGKTDTCERLSSIRESRWSRIPASPGRLKRVSTCGHSDKIYLMAEKHSCIHIFNTISEDFTTIKTSDIIMSPFGICIIGSELVQIYENQAWKWSFSSEKEAYSSASGQLLSLFPSWTVKSSKMKGNTCWSKPVKWGEKVYIFGSRRRPYWPGPGEVNYVAVFEVQTAEIDIRPISA